MANELENAAEALDRLAVAILRTTSDDRPFNELWGWNLPALTRQNIAEFPSKLSATLRRYNPKALPDATVTALAQVPQRVDWLLPNVIPNMAGGNAAVVVTIIKDLCDWVEGELPELPPPVVSIDWKEVDAKGQLPPSLRARLRGLEGHLKSLEPKTAAIANQVEAIASAYAAAERLPGDLDYFEETRKLLEDARGQIEDDARKAGESRDAAANSLLHMQEDEAKASAVLEQLGAAYRATTTKGLASSFSRKALTLNASMYVWVVGLAAALVLGMINTAGHITALKTDLAGGSVTADRLWLQALFVVLSIGAPVWFAWVATKQIGQRFRLAEDYGFKASVAKAYEGYRLEAVRLDPEFERKLFSSTMSRFEEAPLQHLDVTNYGSPVHEFVSSPAFRKALDLVPDLKTVYSNTLAKLAGRAGVGPAAVKDLDE